MQTITKVVTWTKMKHHSGLVGFTFQNTADLKKTPKDQQITNAGETLKGQHELQIIFSSAFKNATCSRLEKLRNSYINEVKRLLLFAVPQFSTKACHNWQK